MSLNIKNERVAEKARRLAAQRKKTQTAVVEEGLDLLAAQESRRLSQDRVDLILQRLLAIAASDGPLVEDSLYDESGLPQ